jgi:hypothetical protein
MTIARFAALAVLSLGVAFGARYVRIDRSSAEPSLQCQSPARVMARLDMLFGRSRPTGEPVSDE